MKIFYWGLIITVCAIMASCGSRKTETKIESESNDAKKSLILYYSQTGATRNIAEELQKQLNIDIDSIVAVESYGTDYDATIERWKKEREEGIKPEIKPLTINIEQYDTIYLGFPIWGGTYASPVETFLSNNSLEGKTIITFATFGSGGIESATIDVIKALPKANVKEGYGVRNARISKAPEEINRFLIENGYKEGKIGKLPDFGDLQPVNAEERAIFDEACGNYQFPLGTPVTVAKRSYEGATDYKFDVMSKNQEGKEVPSTIFVTVTPNTKPEFTRVVR